MHPIDQAILDGTLTSTLLAEHAGRPLPPVGSSYWGDAMRDLFALRPTQSKLPVKAALVAAKQMGASLRSLEAVAR